jgi:hypothetical protein
VLARTVTLLVGALGDDSACTDKPSHYHRVCTNNESFTVTCGVELAPVPLSIKVFPHWVSESYAVTQSTCIFPCPLFFILSALNHNRIQSEHDAFCTSCILQD